MAAVYLAIAVGYAFFTWEWWEPMMYAAFWPQRLVSISCGLLSVVFIVLSWREVRDWWSYRLVEKWRHVDVEAHYRGDEK